MTRYRYKLEDHPGRQKHQCPDCKQMTFVYYVYNGSNKPVDGHYCGYCERLNSCTYHLRPSEYFEQYNTYPDEFQYSEDPETDEPEDQSQNFKTRIPTGILEYSMQNHANSFTKFLLEYLNDDYKSLKKLVQMYKIGTFSDSETLDQYLFQKFDKSDAVVYWQVDVNNECRSGKIMFYNSRGKRLDYTNWIHCFYSEFSRCFKLEQCLYGEHLLKCYPDARNILIVESEKTAILLKHHFLNDTNVLVMSTGSQSGLSQDKFRVFQDLNKDIYLLPDVGCESQWQSKADKINDVLGLDIQVYPSQKFITDYFNEDQFIFKPGEDVADFLIYRQLGQEYR